MSAEYSTDIKKYTKKVDDAAVGSITKFLGIALKNADSRLVSCTDEKELDRIIVGFAAKKLGLTEAAAKGAIQKVCERMKADNTKHRVTFYYLLAEETGTLSKLA
jgi:energy-coupling factor transporter ATP-binding protein EcfA2